MLLTHRREPLRTGVVGEVGEVFRKKCCGLQKGVVVVQIKRIIWGIERTKKEKSLHLSCRSLLFPATSPCHREQSPKPPMAEDVPNGMEVSPCGVSSALAAQVGAHPHPGAGSCRSPGCLRLRHIKETFMFSGQRKLYASQTAQTKGVHHALKEKLLSTLSLKDHGTARGDVVLQQVPSYPAQRRKTPCRSQWQQGLSAQPGNPASHPPQRINKSYHVTHSLSYSLHRARVEEPPCPSSHGSAQHGTFLQPPSFPCILLPPGQNPSSLLHL